MHFPTWAPAPPAVEDPALPKDVSELDITPGIVKALREAEIVTIGDLEQRMQSDRWETSIKGLGETKIEQLRQAHEDYRQNVHPWPETA